MISKNRTNVSILSDDYDDIWESFNDDESDCPFLAICQNLVKGSGVWDFQVFHEGHNHDLSLNPKDHAIIRKLDRKDKFKITMTTYKSAGIFTRYIYTHFDRTKPNNNLIIRDVYNERVEVRRRELNNRILIQIFLQLLIIIGEFSTYYQIKFGD